MEIKGSQTDFEAVLSEDYFERYDACENLLQANEIPLKLSDLRQVFQHIIFEADPGNETAKQHYRDAQVALEKFIREYGQPVDYTKLTPDEINECFLDACAGISNKPDLARIRELVERGADINMHDKLGFAALQYATHIYDRDIMRFFLEHGADINEVIHYKDNTVSTVWLNKVAYSQPEDLRLMLSHGARPNDLDSQGNNALLKYCAGKPDREGVALLLEYGASAQAVNNEGNSALHLVARITVDAEAVQLLIEAGADVNLRNAMGDSPLHVNARFQLAGDERTTNCLIEGGADRDALNADGDTALLLAVRCDKEFVVKALVDHGANKELRDASGQTALDIALSKAFLKTACHIDPQALVAYYKSADRAGIDKIKKAIIDSFRAGMHQYGSNKEGYSIFSRRGEAYLFEDFIEGATPPVVSTFHSDEEALKFLYDTNRSYSSSNETEVTVYQRILSSLHR
ncbi:MAG: hypothetical protein A2W80_17765 [Candidatus Riflebacteria bacterium GWC2_50_8]|nr:MAG: hypothetical protein A2W80_17765 [Candidatus Riflebacteria bacterium GWC2_50_8]